MLQKLQQAVKIRALAVFFIIHLGLALTLFAAARTGVSPGWDETSLLFLAGAITIYGGVMLSVFFIAVPLWPWIKRAQQIQYWKENWASEIPAILEQIPKILAAIQAFIAAWKAVQKPTHENKNTDPIQGNS